MSWFDDSRKNKNKKLANVTTKTTAANSHAISSADNHKSDTLLLKLLLETCYTTLNRLRTVNNISVQAVNSHIQECWAMAASSSAAISDQASAVVAKTSITPAESPLQAIHIPSINNRSSHNSAPSLPSPVSLQNLTNNSADLSSTNYNCANCDIKFDSESSLRVHLQVSSIVSIIYQSITTVQ